MIVRILLSITAACPDVTDGDIAAAVYAPRDQTSPGLWVHTMPDSVRIVMQRRISRSPPVPKCHLCGDSGVAWDALDRATWCPAACAAVDPARDRYPTFVDEWNADQAEKLATRGTNDLERAASQEGGIR